MTPEEKAKLAAESIRRATERRGDDSRLFNVLRGNEGYDITPPKRDPEAEVGRMMEQRMRQPGEVVPSVAREGETSVADMIKQRANQPINPETGMPFYNAPEQEDEDAVMKREMQMRMLQNAAKSGQFGK